MWERELKFDHAIQEQNYKYQEMEEDLEKIDQELSTVGKMLMKDMISSNQKVNVVQSNLKREFQWEFWWEQDRQEKAREEKRKYEREMEEVEGKMEDLRQ